ncbi:MAG TPA: right-handed parallel beta-helix repeat-containing protein, partial [Candidatus Syntrophosphaera sp.]|nr:right-handed parallel beta-helix repeat-containing protein [Candidatus Syntrophosphaera sp.]
AAGAYIGISIPANVGVVDIEGFTVRNFSHLGIAQSWSASSGTTSLIRNNVIVSSNDFLRNGIQVSGNNSQVTGNTVYGASYASEDPTYGSSGILAVNASNVLVQENTVTSADLGITVQNFDWYETGLVVSGVTVSGNDVTQCSQVGICVSGLDDTSNNLLSGIAITNNDIDENAVGIGFSGCAITDLAITENTFNDNPIHIENGQSDALDMQSFIPINSYDNYLVLDQIIYGNGEVLYVHAPKQLIKGYETQTYSVKTLHAQELRFFEVRLKILKEDFEAPLSYSIGPAFRAVTSENYMIGVQTVPDALYHIIDVSGGWFDGGNSSVTGDNLILFSFDMVSKTDANASGPEGSLVDLPLPKVMLWDVSEEEIPCPATVGKAIYIDSLDPDPIIWEPGHTADLNACRTSPNSD